MKQVLAIIYLPVASRSVHRVKEFRRCEEHGNLLAYEGRPLGVEEFNTAAPKVLGESARTLYGSQPLVKLIEVEVQVAPVEAAPAPELRAGLPAPLPKPEPVIDLVKCGVEPIADGFMLVEYSDCEARYMGTSLIWENDAGLVTPFATEEAAKRACPGVLVARPETADFETTSEEDEEAEAVGESAAADTSLVGEAGALPAAGEAAAETPAPAAPANADATQGVSAPKAPTKSERKAAAKAAKKAAPAQTTP